MIYKTLQWITLATLTLSVSLSSAADWPTYMHDGNRSGVTAEQLDVNLVKAWVFPKILPPQEAWADEVKKDAPPSIPCSAWMP